MTLIDGAEAPIIRHNEGQRPENTLSSKNIEYPKRTGRVSPKIRSTQRVYILPFVQVTIMTQTKRKGQILFAPRCPTGKRIECSAARKIQDVKRNALFQIIVAKFLGEKTPMFKNQVVAMAGRVLGLMMITSRTTVEMFGIMENRKNEIQKYREK